jgi:hypothetical protein
MEQNFINQGVDICQIFGKLAKENNTMIILRNLTDMSGIVVPAMVNLPHLQNGRGATGDEPEVRFRN